MEVVSIDIFRLPSISSALDHLSFEPKASDPIDIQPHVEKRLREGQSSKIDSVMQRLFQTTDIPDACSNPNILCKVVTNSTGGFLRIEMTVVPGAPSMHNRRATNSPIITPPKTASVPMP